MSKDKLESITTPAGIAIFPRLNTPETEVNGKELDTPRYKVTLRLDESQPGVPELRERLEALHAEAVEKAEIEFKKSPKNKGKEMPVNDVIRAALDKDGNQIDGHFEITVKTNAVDKQGNEKTVRMFDSKGKPTEAKVGGGSVIKLNLSPSAYGPGPLGTGLSLYLNAVQIIELKEFTGGSAESYGFGEEEGGYEGGNGSPFEQALEQAEGEEQQPEAPSEEAPPAEEPPAEEAPAPAPKPKAKAPVKKVAAPAAAPKATVAKAAPKAAAATPTKSVRARGDF